MHQQNYLFVLVVVVFIIKESGAQHKWIWPKTNSNQKRRSFYPSVDKEDYYAAAEYVRGNRDREPTTKRPLPGQPLDDDIDDYTDANEFKFTKQNSPYEPPGLVGHPIVTGHYNGFGNQPQNNGYPGNIANGILVGPGGPTGIIGRPPSQYPVAGGPSSFPGSQAGYPNYAPAQNFPGPAVNNNQGFGGYNGLNNGLGQYPNTQQYAGGHYPQQPQYTEGYGLIHLNPGAFNANPQFNGNFNPAYGFNFDEFSPQVETKNSRFTAVDQKVDDKVTKPLKKF